ncbi:hypothetical protein N2599_07130 [Rhizobium sullae]|uniref:Uncharacterized protein n=1 Tax=Rhizobium sullae TaxID=50338 RepID=A0ABY5XMP0_RHISU|nr:hypothetical protein [Rhizobium sullae]UWU15761.1 hypothetical protein N2599_07130 [Rhizobium sullae]
MQSRIIARWRRLFLHWGGSEGVPARMAARAVEWSLGDEAVIVASVADVHFRKKPG